MGVPVAEQPGQTYAGQSPAAKSRVELSRTEQSGAEQPPERRLRLLFCNWRDTAHPEGGGSEVYVESVARSLAAAGHAVTLFCAAHPRGAAEEIVDGVRIVRAGSKLGVYPTALRLLRSGRLGTPDVVVDVQNGIPFCSPLATHAPVVVLVHHVHREQWPVVYGPVRSRIGWFLESRFAPRVYRRSRYVAVSAATRDELVGLGVDADRISVVHNGTAAPPETAYGPDPEPRILVLGRLVPHKRVEHVLTAAAALRSDHPGLRVAVVGDGWWAPRLGEHAHRLGVDDLVEFVGFVDEARKHTELARAWVLALPSLKEGWGLVVLEAAGHGVPAVGYRAAGGVAESIVDGRTGILVDGAEPEFTAALAALLGDPLLRKEYGEQARERSGTFGWADTAAAFAAVIESAVSDREHAQVRNGLALDGGRRGVVAPGMHVRVAPPAAPAQIHHDEG